MGKYKKYTCGITAGFLDIVFVPVRFGSFQWLFESFFCVPIRRVVVLPDMELLQSIALQELLPDTRKSSYLHNIHQSLYWLPVPDILVEKHHPDIVSSAGRFRIERYKFCLIRSSSVLLAEVPRDVLQNISGQENHRLPSCLYMEETFGSQQDIPLDKGRAGFRRK